MDNKKLASELLEIAEELSEKSDRIRNADEYIIYAYEENIVQGLEYVLDAWWEWKNGPATEKQDIKPAQRELIKYVSDWMKKNIK